MTSLEEQCGRHKIILQKIKGMFIRMQAKDDKEEEDDQDLGVQTMFYFIVFVISLKLLLVWLGSAWNLFMFLLYTLITFKIQLTYSGYFEFATNAWLYKCCFYPVELSSA